MIAEDHHKFFKFTSLQYGTVLIFRLRATAVQPSNRRFQPSVHPQSHGHPEHRRHFSPTLRSRSPCASWAPPLHRGLVRGSFPAPHHHDPNEMLPNFQIWVMVASMSLSRLDDLSLWTQYALVCVYVHKGKESASALRCVVLVFIAFFSSRTHSMRKWRIWTFRHSMWSSPSSRLRWKVSVGPAEVVGAKTTVEVSTVAEMLVSKVALLGFLIVVSVGGQQEQMQSREGYRSSSCQANELSTSIWAHFGSSMTHS